MAISILVNGEPRELPEGSQLNDLIEAMKLVGKRYAVEVNAEIIPRAEHDRHPLRDGDKVEIVQAIGGG